MTDMLNDLLRKSWLQLLGVLLMAASVLTLRNFAIDEASANSLLYEFEFQSVWVGVLADSNVYLSTLPSLSHIFLYFGCLLACVLIRIGVRKSSDAMKASSIGIWFMLVTYGFVVHCIMTKNSDSNNGFLPFLNGTSFIWGLLAAMGFYYSMRVSMGSLRPEDNRLLSILYSAVSHLMIGMLLIGQVKRLILEYGLEPVLNLHLALSMVWGIHAWVLFLWAACSNQSLFRVLGSLVLLCVSVQTLVYDVPIQQAPYKAIVLFILGIVTFGIAILNGTWRNKAIAERRATLVREAQARYAARPDVI